MRSAEARKRAACGPVRNAMRKMRGNSAPGAKPDVQRLVDRSVRRRADVGECVDADHVACQSNIELKMPIRTENVHRTTLMARGRVASVFLLKSMLRNMTRLMTPAIPARTMPANVKYRITAMSSRI